MTREKNLHYLKMFLVIFTLSGIAVLLNGYQVQAAGSSATYKKAYTKKLNNIRKKNAGYINDDAEAIIRDMNGDKTPELLVNLKPYGSVPAPWTVYTYRNKKVKKSEVLWVPFMP